MIEKFDGKVTIRINFRNRPEYEKFRKYILKTDWTYAIDYPMFEELICEFHNCEDLEEINKRIFFLLQLGFEVYCCRYQVDQSSIEEEPEEEHKPEDFTQEEIDQLWREYGKVKECYT